MSSDVFFLNDKWIKKIDRKTQILIDRTGTDRKTESEVFDKSTLMVLGKLISDKIIDSLDFPISTGKEANIFRGVAPDKTFVAVKIFRTATSTFKHLSMYLEGDPRFQSLNKTHRDIIFEWAKKEFKNLERLHKAKVRAPKPIKRINNVLVMEYIGDANQPAPMMKDVPLHDPKKIFNAIVLFMSRMYKHAGLVHADMSAYNILMYNDQPYVIDLGQGVLLGHPMAREFLKRDIHNIARHFARYGIKADEEKIFTRIVGKVKENEIRTHS